MYPGGVHVQVGQVWKSNDPRDSGGTSLRIIAVGKTYVTVIRSTGKKTRIRIDRMKTGSRGYRRVA